MRTIRGVQWYNDSIASSPTRTIAGLNAFNEKVILLAGGYDKHIPFAPLAPEVVKHVKLLILCGATADAIEKAVKAVDGCVEKVIETARECGYDVVQIADHGNADHAKNADGSPNTAHSLNPVPILVVSDRVEKVKNGVLADVAPTVLALMGLKQPPEMTGHSLVEMKV